MEKKNHFDQPSDDDEELIHWKATEYSYYFMLFKILVVKYILLTSPVYFMRIFHDL